MRDKKLFELCLSFLQDFYQCKRIGDVYFGNRYEFVFNLYKIEKICVELSSYIKLVEYMSENEIISKHINNSIGLWNYRIGRTAWEYLQYFISRQKLISNKFEFDERLFNIDYINFEDFFYNEYFVMRVVVRLNNFIMDVDEFIIEDNIKITKIKDEEYEELGYTEVIRGGYSEYILQLTHKEKKYFGELDREVAIEGQERYVERLNLLFNIINVLRLYKSGNLKTGEYFTRLLHPVITLGIGTGLVNSNDFPFNPYKIDKAEFDDFMNLWSKLNKIKFESFKEFSIALRRLGYAMDRNRYDDKLVDLVISFESILLKQSEMSELYYRMSVRLSKLLEKDYKKRLELKNDMREIYNLRSRIVHGSDYKIDPNLISKCEEYLRNVLKKYIIYRHIMSHDEIINRLDYTEFN